MLRGDPAHKMVNPVLYRYEEVHACWREVSAPVLWVDAAESDTPKRLNLDAGQLAERRAAFRDLRFVTVPDAGHMLHHDQPQAVARLLEEFLRALMAQYFSIHPLHPQKRLIRQAADIVRRGGLIAYPTDSCYALGCDRGNAKGAERLRRIRGIDERHHLTLMCRDLSEMARYAIVDDAQFRLLKSVTPGSYTFILRARREVPRRLTQEEDDRRACSGPSRRPRAARRARRSPCCPPRCCFPARKRPSPKPGKSVRALKKSSIWSSTAARAAWSPAR